MNAKEARKLSEKTLARRNTDKDLEAFRKYEAVMVEIRKAVGEGLFEITYRKGLKGALDRLYADGYIVTDMGEGVADLYHITW